MSTKEYGLFINFDYCTGCHTCEIACKKEHDLPEGQWGIKVMQDGPRQNADGTWDYTYLPLPTSLCDPVRRPRERRAPAHLRAPLPGARHGVRHVRRAGEAAALSRRGSVIYAVK